MLFIRNKLPIKKINLTLPNLYHTPKHIHNDLILLRHAQSFYNVASEKYIRQNNLGHLTWDEICQIPDFNLDINYNSRFIDTDLSEKGVIQCFNLREEFLASGPDVDLILCSPLTRALRTCRHVFDPLKIKKIIIPELTEVLRYACDINNDIEQKKQQFPQFDWTLFPQKNNFWFLNTQPASTAEIITSSLKQNQLKTYAQAQYQLLMLLYEQKIFESDFELRARAKRVKQIVSSYKALYKKIVVISHHYMLQHLLAQRYREDSQPITEIVDEVPNAVMIETSVMEVNEVV